MTMENPHLPDSFDTRSLPEDHPANQKQQLTVLQSFALPILMWFFDSRRYIGQGRSYLAAHVLIRLAIQGEPVDIDDMSVIAGQKARVNQYFIHTLLAVMQKDFPDHIFTINKAHMKLTFNGIRPK